MDSYTYFDITSEGLEWHAVDRCGRVGYFYNQGTLLVPDDVVRSKKSTEMVADYMEEELVDVSEGYILSQGARAWQSGLTDGQFDQFVRFYAAYSKKGFYTYVCNMEEWVVWGPYYLVTLPRAPLQIVDLPMWVQEILRRHVMDVEFGEGLSSISFPESQTFVDDRPAPRGRQGG